MAVVGATGAVGREFLQLFDRREFPVSDLRLLASARSAGLRIPFRGDERTVAEATPDAFEGVDVAFFSAGASRSRDLVPAALAAGALVVDNSSAFRMRADVPLVVPEINLDAVPKGGKLVAVPNCSAILLLMAVHPLRALGRIERIIVSTYQSASGGGAAVMEELREATRAALEGRDYAPNAVPHPYAFNLFSHNTAIGPTGANEEETKMVEESRKILGMPDLRINATCVRVPVLRAHSESVTVEFADAAPSEEAARGALAAAPGVRVVDDREGNLFPMPATASGGDDVLVGRIRRDPSKAKGLCLFLAGDQLLKGAALNAVQIAEAVIARDGI